MTSPAPISEFTHLQSGFPTESDSSSLALHTPTDHQIAPLARLELVEEMEEKERMSTNAQIVTNSTLEQCFSRLPRNVVAHGTRAAIFHIGVPRNTPSLLPASRTVQSNAMQDRVLSIDLRIALDASSGE